MNFLSRVYKRVKLKTVFIIFPAAVFTWIIISTQAHQFFNDKLYIGLRKVIICRIWLAALFFLGKRILFPRISSRNLFNWSYSLIFFLIIGTQVFKAFNYKINWFYLLFYIIDIGVVSFFLAGLVEIIGGAFRNWILITDEIIKETDKSWRYFWKDALKLGFLLTMFMCLAYYYLINFYLVDTLLYSYLLVAPVIGGGIAFFTVFVSKTREIIQEEIDMIDNKLASYLNCQNCDPSELNILLPRFQFLYLLRQYMHELKKPYISTKAIFCYILFCCFILILPYLLGAVIEV